MKQCPKCGSGNWDDDSICAACGTSLSAAFEQRTDELKAVTTDHDRLTTRFILERVAERIVTVLIAIAVIGGGAALWYLGQLEAAAGHAWLVQASGPRYGGIRINPEIIAGFIIVLFGLALLSAVFAMPIFERKN